MEKYIAYDIGAISVNRAIVDKNGKLLDVMPYTRHHGEPVRTRLKDIESLLKKNDFRHV